MEKRRQLLEVDRKEYYLVLSVFNNGVGQRCSCVQGFYVCALLVAYMMRVRPDPKNTVDGV